jgi:UDP-N-acetylglucosamine diphosphorylase/glucosamine-1-phosphate N-acetyltransferase
MDLRLFLFDDQRARSWQPFRLTRPVGELRFGCMTLRERSERATGFRVVAYLGCDDLEGFEEAGAPPVRPRTSFSDAEPLHHQPKVVLSSRAVLERAAGPLLQPGATAPEPLRQWWESWAKAWGGGGESSAADPSRAGRIRLTVGGVVVGWLVPPRQSLPEEAALTDPTSDSSGPAVELPGEVLDWPWRLVEANPRRIAADVAVMQRGSSLFGLTDVRTIGEHHLSLGQDAHVEPGVVLDVREGPIRLDAKVYVQAPARLSGPLHVGEGTVIFGGSVGASSIGPVCKVRGEVDSSVVGGYCNKAHDGYLGHALLGSWVNLGALTTNSDLKNNYSPVRVRLNTQELATDLLKVGCFLGDHVKTGIGTLIPTGGVVGAGSNVFGGGVLPRYVPPFSWGSSGELSEFRLEQLLEVAEAAMGRRGVALTMGARDLLRRAWERSRSERAG